jgi:hypothetical protein
MNFHQSPLFCFYLNSNFFIFQRAWRQEQATLGNLKGDDGQPNAPIQQGIASPSIQMIVANAAGRGGRVETGGRQRGKDRRGNSEENHLAGIRDIGRVHFLS